MDFDDSPNEATFRAEVRAWLAAHAEPRRHPRDFVGDGLPPAERLAAARAWQAKKAAAGYAAITWPREFGGRDGSVVEQLIYLEEEQHWRSTFGYFEIGVGMCLPTLMVHGSDAHRSRHLRPGLYGEEIWCQLFSEPAAGSDLAGVLTRARRDGDAWIVDGQKTWTTGAQFSDFGLLLVRTDPTLPKHAGLTMLFVDMKSPGIEVRPIRQMAGESEFNEVFFSGVRVPDAQRLGAVGAGWKVALTTLMNERLTVGTETGLAGADALLRAAHALGHLGDDSVVEQLADAWIVDEGLRLHRCRTLTALARGAQPGPEQSIGKLLKASLSQRVARLALDLRGVEGLVAEADATSPWAALQRTWSWSAARRIAGGPAQIQRNVIAERVLGLPEEIRLDKGLPFNEVPR
ncbi:MAG: acyl-CoA dehydrogenase family protein [Pseudomonadota bacterium]